MTQSLIGLGAGIGVGLLLSVLGAGGSAFIVPVMVYALHRPVSEATGTSLAVVFAGALVGAIGHWRKGNLEPKVAVPFGGAAIVGALGGAALHSLVADRVLLGIFAGTLFVVAVRMAVGNREAVPSSEPQRMSVLLVLGALMGLLSGFLGVGGGFLMVPALTWGARLPLRQAIGTSLAVMALSSLSGAIGHAVQGHVSLWLLGTVGGGTVVGALIGTPLSGRLPERPLRLGFAGLALILGIYIAVRVALGT